MKAQGIIDYTALKAELEAVLGHSDFHLAGEEVKVPDGSFEQLATVRGDGLDEATVQATLDAHVAAGPRRASLAAIDAQIRELEAKTGMPRVLRDVVLATAPDSKGKEIIADIEAQLEVLRQERKKL